MLLEHVCIRRASEPAITPAPAGALSNGVKTALNEEHLGTRATFEDKAGATKNLIQTIPSLAPSHVPSSPTPPLRPMHCPLMCCKENAPQAI